MFKHLLLSGLGLTILFVALGSASGQPPPVGWYRLDEASGPTAFDSGTSGSNGDWLLPPPLWVGGIEGQALSFDDSVPTAGLHAPSTFSLGTTNVSVAAWVNLDSTSESGAFVKIGDPLTGYGLGVGGSNFDNGGNDLIGLYEQISWHDTNTTLGTGWHHVALVVDGSGHPTFYRDGAPLGYTSTATPLTPTGNETTMGGYIASNGNNRFVDAIVDDVQVYNRALNLTDVNTIMGSPGTTLSGAVAQWKMNEGAGTTAGASVGGVDATMTSPTIVPGLMGNALRFEEDRNDQVAVNSTFGLGSTGMTMAMWVDLESASESGAFLKIGDVDTGFGLGVGGSTFDDAGNNLIALFEKVRWIDSGVDIGTGPWHHVAMVVDAAGLPELFIDGDSIGTFPGTAALAPGGNTTSIGGYIASNGNDRFVDATIDDVRIYNEALTDDQIRALVRAATSVIPEPSTLLIWSLLGAMGFGTRCLRRKRRVSSASRPS